MDCFGLYVWNKLYRRELFQSGIRFDESVLFGEDRCFLFDISPYTKSVSVMEDKLYRYRKNASSLTGRFRDRPFERTLWKLKIIEHIFASWDSYGDLISGLAWERLVCWSRAYIARALPGRPTTRRAWSAAE